MNGVRTSPSGSSRTGDRAIGGAVRSADLDQRWHAHGRAARTLGAACLAALAFLGHTGPTVAQAPPTGQWQTDARPAARPAKPQRAPADPARGTPAAAATAPAVAPGLVEATAATLAGDGARTRFRLTLAKAVRAEIVTLANPYRVIIDMPNVGFRLPAGTGRSGSGLVSAFRYGLFAEGKARIVLDATGPVLIDKAAIEPGARTAGHDLVIDLVPTDAATFGTGTGAHRAAGLPDARPAVNDEAPAALPKSRAKPVVMIDPGHGGIDPGAVGSGNLYEKAIVLAVGRELRSQLAATGRYEVVMTRQTDVFVSLDQRLKLSARHAPDLFISLHADSIDAKSLTQAIRGASVYTLSERASDELARLMAEKENASDRLAGLETVEMEGQEDVRSILIDLLKRETANFSSEFSRILVGRLARASPMSRDPIRAAAFKVLKQTGSPSVLVELGYMSNPEDEKLMTSADWQKRVAQAIAQAVDQFFARSTARAR